MLPEDVIQFLLFAAENVGIPGGGPQDLINVVHLGHAAIFEYKEDGDFERSLQASWPSTEGWYGCEDPARENYTRVKEEVV
jgi:hypothetical protein